MIYVSKKYSRDFCIPKDATKTIKKSSRFNTFKNGGDGAIREIAEKF